MREKVLEKIQKESQKKVMMNFHIDPDLKSSFEESCKSDGVTMSAAIIAMIETYIEEANAEKYKSIREVIRNVDQLLLGMKDEKNRTPDKFNELMKARTIIESFINDVSHLIPETNNWNYSAVYSLEHYPVFIDSTIQLATEGNK